MKRLYVNKIIILFELKYFNKQNSKAVIKKATFENLIDILTFQDSNYLNKFDKFLRIGDIGYFAYLNGKCIHRSWVKSKNQVVFLHWTIPYKLKDNEVFIHYSETAKEERGKNIFPHILTQIVNEHNDKNILISVNKNNVVSIKSIKKVGFFPKKTIQSIVILGIRYKRNLAND